MSKDADKVSGQVVCDQATYNVRIDQLRHSKLQMNVEGWVDAGTDIYGYDWAHDLARQARSAAFAEVAALGDQQSRKVYQFWRQVCEYFE